MGWKNVKADRIKGRMQDDDDEKKRKVCRFYFWNSASLRFMSQSLFLIYNYIVLYCMENGNVVMSAWQYSTRIGAKLKITSTEGVKSFGET